MKKWLSIVLALCLCGCTAQTPSPPIGPEENQKLTICTSHKQDVWWPIVKEFETRTGIWVEVIEGGTNELLEQLDKGDIKADIVFGGGVETLDSYADLFAPYTSQHAREILPQYHCESGIWTPFSSLPLVLIYNPKLVVPGTVSGWADLLNPELEGKIAFADPTVSGSSYTALATLLQAIGADTDETLQAFAKNLDGRQLASSGDVVSAVSSGEALVGITIEETALRRIHAGDTLVMVYPRDGTSCVPDGCAIVKGAAHLENAQAFVDFTLSQDVQIFSQEQLFRRSVLTDLANAQEPRSLVQVDYDILWASQNRDKLLMSWQFYFGTEDLP